MEIKGVKHHAEKIFVDSVAGNTWGRADWGKVSLGNQSKIFTEAI